jgi:alkanesulfonate monooxygenase SsuD/methylene tetrahydromethanopterin reductase-like flavin-dependent oxidoreductase (luciferase family)
MLGANVVAAESDDEARFLASSGRQSFASLRAGRPIPLPPPSAEWARDGATEPDDPMRRTRVSFVGSPGTVAAELREFVSRTGADEVIVAAHVYDHAARLRSYEIAAAVAR